MAGNLKWYGNRVFTLATEANVRAMHKAALLVEGDVKKNFTLLGQGRRYGRHTASRPGEPPAIDTGILRASIMNEVELNGLSVDGRVGPDVEHIAAKAPVGTNVEYGCKMEPRPFLRPALHRTRKKVVKIFKEANQ
jgi:hypothetical protein